jgi:hypothetical protein
MSNAHPAYSVPPTYWTPAGEANTSPTFESELKGWKVAFWVDDYVFNDLIALLEKHQINPNPKD